MRNLTPGNFATVKRLCVLLGEVRWSRYRMSQHL